MLHEGNQRGVGRRVREVGIHWGGRKGGYDDAICCGQGEKWELKRRRYDMEGKDGWGEGSGGLMRMGKQEFREGEYHLKWMRKKLIEEKEDMW